MKEKCLEYSALLAILTQIKKANKYKQYNCIKYWRSGQLIKSQKFSQQSVSNYIFIHHKFKLLKHSTKKIIFLKKVSLNQMITTRYIGTYIQDQIDEVFYYEASNYMEGIEDHFQANQLLFISVSDPDPDPNLNLTTLIPISY